MGVVTGWSNNGIDELEQRALAPAEVPSCISVRHFPPFLQLVDDWYVGFELGKIYLMYFANLGNAVWSSGKSFIASLRV
jgi:hypothetical protein